MKKNMAFLLLGIALILIGVILLLIKPTGEVCFSNNCFKVKIADNFSTQALGLMFKKDLKQNEGLLFIFPKEKVYLFWMKNTWIPLDIIWLNQNKEVVFINKNSQPCGNTICHQINPNVLAKYVLEINAGLVEKIGLSIGSKLTF